MMIAGILIAFVVGFFLGKSQSKPKSVQAVSAAPVTAAPTASAVVSNTDDEEELIAVITAAIAAISGGANVNIVSIRRGGEAWVLSGRQDVMRGF